MHSFFHPETGVSINYNSDNSGDAWVSVPGDAPELDGGHNGEGNYWSVKIPAAALADFSRQRVIHEVIAAIEDL